jgi:tetratricopeptide (TPR) repeat protein
MEMKLLKTLVVLFFLGNLHASDVFLQGVKKMEEESYAEAIELFEAHVQEFPLDDNGYYNLGMAHYRNKDYPRGLWAFEKSLKLNPSNEDAAANAAYAYEKLKLKGEWRQETGIFARLFFGVGKNLWAWLAVLSSVLLGLFIALNFIFKSSNAKVFIQFFTAVISLCFLSSLTLAYLHRTHLTTMNNGIIVSASAIGKAGPQENQKTLFTLPAGQKVVITEKKDGWTEVKLSPETIGWIPDEDVLAY